MNSSTTSARRPFAWRITRYDPNMRDDRGAYLKEDWTSIADVGKAFDGRVLTRTEYEQTEALYAAAASRFASEAGFSSLAVTHIEMGEDRIPASRTWPVEDATLINQMLREEVICRLEEQQGHFRLDVGTDLYLFIESATDCPQAVDACRADGLFVEPGFRSPFWRG